MIRPIVRAFSLLAVGILVFAALAATGLIATATIGWLWLANGLPDPRQALVLAPPPCPAALHQAAEAHATVPHLLRAAIVAAEDPGFEQQWLLPSLRSFSGRRSLAQLVADHHLWAVYPNDRAIIRQFQRVVQGDRVFFSLSKEEILAAYTRQVYLGHHLTGVRCAAAGYFGKTLEQLSLEEAALLAGLIRAPATYDPIGAPDRAQARRNVVIDAMVAAGNAGPEEAGAAKRAPLGVAATLQ